MTYCIGMRCADGLIGIADTRLTSGDVDYVVTGKKIFIFKEKKHALFIMFSGLKSLGDEMIAILNNRAKEFLDQKKIYQGLDFIAKVMRELRHREEQWLERGNLPFDLNCIVGGQFEGDHTAQLFRIYPEGSWTRVRRDTPFELIGEVKYGKPLLDRTFNCNISVDKALLIGLISFDTVWKSNPLVHPPLDIVSYKLNSFEFTQRRLHEKDLMKLRVKWEESLSKVIEDLNKLRPKLIK